MVLQSILLGLLMLACCVGLGLFLVNYLAKRQDKRYDAVEDALNSSSERWDSEMLDPKFNSRSPLAKSYRFGDLPISLLPEGIMINDGGTFFFLEHRTGSQAARIARRRFPIDFIAMERNYCWIQGGGGKFQLHGAIARGQEFRKRALDHGIGIYDGVPDGAELPRRFKG